MPNELSSPITIKRIHLWAPTFGAIVTVCIGWYARGRDLEDLRGDIAAVNKRLDAREVSDKERQQTEEMWKNRWEDRIRGVEAILNQVKGALDKPQGGK